MPALASRQRHPQTLRVEALEQRNLLSAIPTTATGWWAPGYIGSRNGQAVPQKLPRLDLDNNHTPAPVRPTIPQARPKPAPAPLPPGPVLYDGNTPTKKPLTAPSLAGQTKILNLTIGNLSTKTTERMGVNVGDMNAFTQGNIVNNLVTQIGTFELAHSRMPVHAANVIQGTSQLIIKDAWYWDRLKFSSAIGQKLVSISGANNGGEWTITGMTGELDTAGNATGRAIITLEGNLNAAPVYGDAFYVDIHAIATQQLADYVSPKNNATLIRDTTVAHGGSASARADFGAGTDNLVQMQEWFGADSTAGRNILQPGHTYEISVWARATAAGGSLKLWLSQGPSGNGGTFSVAGDGAWRQYTVTVNAVGPITLENGVGSVMLGGTTQSVWIDDLKIVDKTAHVPGTALNGQVVDLLKDYGFGELRFWHGALRYASFDDLVGNPENRPALSTPWDQYDPQVGLPEMLQLAKQTGANPWIVISPSWGKDDIAHLMEYLGGDVSTPYGALRAADGHAGSWFADLGRIDIESGNESWNGTFAPYAFTSPMEPYFARTQEMFTDIKSSPYYQADKMSLIVNGWQWVPWYTQRAVDLTPAADAVSVSSYLAASGSDTTSREFYGSVLSQQLVNNKKEYPSTIFGKKVYVYEMNAGEIGGNLTPATEGEYATSLSAGLAVARQSMTLARDYGISNQNLFQFVQRGLPMAKGYTLGHYGIFADMTTAQTNPRPVALAAKLMNSAAGTIVSSTLTSGWTVDPSAATGTAAATIQAGDAMVTYNGSALVITLFNSTVEDTRNTTFHFKLPALLDGKRITADWSAATFQTLTGPSAASGNETTKTVDITPGKYNHGLSEVYASLPGHSMGVLTIPVKF